MALTDNERAFLLRCTVPHEDGDCYQAIDWRDEDLPEEVYTSLKTKGYIVDVGHGFVRITNDGLEAYEADDPNPSF